MAQDLPEQAGNLSQDPPASTATNDDTNASLTTSPQPAPEKFPRHVLNPYMHGSQQMPPLVTPDDSPSTLAELRLQTAQLCEVIYSNHPPLGGAQASWDVHSGASGIARVWLKLHTCDPDFRICGVNALTIAEEYMESAIASCERYLEHCREIHTVSHHVGYLRSQSGVWATAATLYDLKGNMEKRDAYIDRLVAMRKVALSRHTPHELSFGRPGYLYALLYVRRNVEGSSNRIPDELLENLVNAIVADGNSGTRRRYRMPADREGAVMEDTASPPLMWLWFMEQYLGAGHGMAGALQALMNLPAMVMSSELSSDVKGALSFLMNSKLSNGNYKQRRDETFTNSPQLFDDKENVNFCHGATGIALCLCRAYEIYGDEAYFEAAKEAAEVVWKRGLVRDNISLTDGVSGNVYLFLSLYKITGQLVYWQRALCFTTLALSWAQPTAKNTGVTAKAYGLFDGLGGLAYLLCDMGFWNEEEFIGFPAFADGLLEDFSRA